MTITALDEANTRSIVAEVAGAAALLVAKAHKLHDRVVAKREGRLDDKDAADIVRLMQTTSPEEVGVTLAWKVGGGLFTNSPTRGLAVGGAGGACGPVGQRNWWTEGGSMVGVVTTGGGARRAGLSC
jgi:hypothetical protein